MIEKADSLNEILAQRLSPSERALLCRIGDLRSAGRRSKHKGGYRAYEIECPQVSEQDIWLYKEDFLSHGLMTESMITKFWEDGRRERLSLLDLTPLGLCIYLNLRASSGSLHDSNLNLLYFLIGSGAISFRSLSSDLLVAYLKFFDALPREPGTDPSKPSGFLRKSEVVESEKKLNDLREAVNNVDRHTVSNYQISQLYDLIDRISVENKEESPRKGYIVLILTIIRDILTVSAGVASAVLAYLAFLKG